MGIVEARFASAGGCAIIGPMTANPVQRRFLRVGSRRVHYLRSGEGPPVVLIHSSPANTRLLEKDISRLSRDFTVFAFDTPGFGLSDPLPLATMTVADLADAMAQTMVAAGLPRCPVFGTHTGASIALEVGVRHPDRVTGLVLDGLAAFTAEECATLFGTYFRELPISDLGGHYSDTWTRFRDQSLWFPWTARSPAALNDYDLSPPHSTHLWMQMYYEAVDSYEPAYRAAIFHGDVAIIAGVRSLSIPAVFCATQTDMLHSHLDRLPPLGPDQQIVAIGSSTKRKRELVAASFARFGADGHAPADRATIASSVTVDRQFVDGSAGQLHLRFAGDRVSPALLLIHDAPGSSEQAEPLIARLAATHFVIAPDLPGHGESDAFAAPPDLAAFAAELLRLLDTLGIASAQLHGLGFGSSLALALAAEAPDRFTALTLHGLPLPDADERAAMLAHYAPPIAIDPDGGHWYRTWLMLRDSQLWFPWYDRRRDTLRRQPADLSARRLHRWTIDVMRARDTYAHLIHAALAVDNEALLTATRLPLTLVTDAANPLGHFDDRAATLRPDAVTPGHDAGLPVAADNRISVGSAQG